MFDAAPTRLVLVGEFQGQAVAQPFPAKPGVALRVGRARRLPPDDPMFRPDYGSDLVFPADKSVSRFHATVTWDGSRLLVRRHPGASAPVLFFDPADPAAPQAEADDGAIPVGGRFRIGDTRFTLRTDAPEPVERTLSNTALNGVRFADPAPRIDALAALPRVIESAPDDDRLADELLAVALNGVPRAAAAAVVELHGPADPVCVVRCQSRAGGDVRPSRQLVQRAVGSFENVCYVWPTADARADAPTNADDTAWAICVRLPGDRDHGLYLSGTRAGGPGLLDADLKFVRLAADIYAGLRDLRAVREREQFFLRMLSPTVRAAVGGRSLDEVTAPREAVVTVLFCDLRGFTGMVEGGAGDLAGTWDLLSQALDLMTGAIAEHDGVVGDFQGDAVMAFWGWPVDQPDQVERAARAALAIRKRFVALAGRPGHPLGRLFAGGTFPCGIGLAHGPAMAGRLGSSDQVKLGVFGPVVNRAARLEAATKKFRVPILADEAVLRELPGRPGCRTRRIAKVRPKGIPHPVLVGELLPPESEPGPNLKEADRRRYEAALDHFLAGRWDEFRRVLAGFPADGPADFLRKHAEPGSTAEFGANWDGGVPVE